MNFEYPYCPTIVWSWWTLLKYFPNHPKLPQLLHSHQGNLSGLFFNIAQLANYLPNIHSSALTDQVHFNVQLKFTNIGIFLAVQWLRLHIPNVGGMGLIPGWGKSGILHGMAKKEKKKKKPNTYCIPTYKNDQDLFLCPQHTCHKLLFSMQNCF